MSHVTGDLSHAQTRTAQVGVTFHNFPRVLDTKLAAKLDDINVASQSGKTLGAQVMVVDNLVTPTEAAIYVASGDSDVSTWVVVQIVLGTGQVTVTPA